MRENFDYNWLHYFLEQLKEKSPKQHYVVRYTVFLDNKDKEVARRLSITKQRVSILRKQGLTNLRRMLSAYLLPNNPPT